jgi:hypothetical protein
MGDFSFEDLKDPKQCQTMWGIANKTIEMQKKRIVYLQSRVFFFNKLQERSAICPVGNKRLL